MGLLLANRAIQRTPGAIDPEVAAWKTRVIANSGTVSDATLGYVNTFVLALKSAGLRNRYLRLNLFIGDQLAACLTPLFLNGDESLSVFLGNTYDTNNNFVGGDYSESGANGGLQGNGSNSYLDTGFNPLSISQLGVNSGGLVVYNRTTTITNNRYFMGAQVSTPALTRFGSLALTSGFFFYANDTIGGASITPAKGLILTRRSSATVKKQYFNGSLITTTTRAAIAKPGTSMFIFTLSVAGTPSTISNALLNCYGITDSVANDTEAATMSTLLNNLYTNLSRNEY